MRRLFAVAVSVLMTVGCSGTSGHTFRDAGPDYRLSDNSDKGLVIVSTRFSSDCKDAENQLAGFEYQDVSSRDYRVNMIPLFDPRTPRDFETPPGHFSVKTFYAGNQWIRRLHLGDISRETRTFFDVTAGQAVYLGEVHVKITDCVSPQSFVITTQVTDQWERDSKLFQARMKNIRPEEVVKRLLGTRTAQQ